MAININQKDLTLSTLQPTPINTVPAIFVPLKPTLPVQPIAVPRINGPIIEASGIPVGGNPSGKNGFPFPLLSVKAIQTPVKQQSFTDCNITVSFTRNTSDVNFDHVNIWFVGYHGGTNPVLVAAGTVSPMNFICDATKENVTVIAQTVSSNGQAAPLSFGLSTSLVLSGIVGPPPAPTISQSLVGTPTGYQFGFNQVVLPVGDEEVISAYNVYRALSNIFGAASLRTTIVPNPGLTGTITYTDTINDAVGSAYFYFVTAVNTAGFESTPTAAQTTTIAGSIGSLPPSISTPFTLTGASTSVTISTSPSCFFTRADGTKVLIGQTSQAVTGLPTGNNVFFFPYWRETDQTLQFVKNTDVVIPNITYVTMTAASLQYVETTTVAAIPPAFSVEIWVQGSVHGSLFDHSAPQVIGSTTSSVCQAIVTPLGEVEFSIFNGSTWTNVITSGASVLDSTFHHIVCSYSAGIGTIYIDGVFTSDDVTFWQNLSMGTIATTTGSWHFGVVAGLSGAPTVTTTYNTFNISHIAIYNAGLTAIQAGAHIQAFSNLGEVAYLAELTFDTAVNLWKLNDVSGTSAVDSIGTNTGTYKASPTLNQSAPVITVLGIPTIAWPFDVLGAIQMQNLRNRTPLSNGGLVGTTSSASLPPISSGGSNGGYNGGGGRGGGCFTGDTLIKTGRGNVAIRDIVPGDVCLTAKGNWLPVLQRVAHEARLNTLHQMQFGELVTYSHKLLIDGKWVEAGTVFPRTIEVEVPIYTLTMESNEPLDQMLSPTTERSFTLSSGVIAHNLQIQKPPFKGE